MRFLHRGIGRKREPESKAGDRPGPITVQMDDGTELRIDELRYDGVDDRGQHVWIAEVDDDRDAFPIGVKIGVIPPHTSVSVHVKGVTA